VVLEALEQAGSGVDPPLREAQLGEPGECLGVHDRLGRPRDLDRELELELGLVPAAEREQDRAVVGAAERIQVGVAVAAVEAVGGPDPLGGALELGGQAAGGDGLAARVHGRVGAPLAAQRGGHRLVEQGGARGHVAEPDQLGAELGDRAQLEVDVALAAGNLQRLAGEPLGPRAVVRLAGERGAAQQHPPAQRRQIELLHEPRRRFVQPWAAARLPSAAP